MYVFTWEFTQKYAIIVYCVTVRQHRLGFGGIIIRIYATPISWTRTLRTSLV